MTTSEFARDVLKIDPEVLKKRVVFIKFIVAEGRVVFDPELFAFFESHYGEDSLYHKDIAANNNVDLSKVQGGAFVGVGDNFVKVSGFSTQFGGVEEHAEAVREFFERYFDCLVRMEI